MLNGQFVAGGRAEKVLLQEEPVIQNILARRMHRKMGQATSAGEHKNHSAGDTSSFCAGASRSKTLHCSEMDLQKGSTSAILECFKPLLQHTSESSISSISSIFTLFPLIRNFQDEGPFHRIP